MIYLDSLPQAITCLITSYRHLAVVVDLDSTTMYVLHLLLIHSIIIIDPHSSDTRVIYLSMSIIIDE